MTKKNRILFITYCLFLIWIILFKLSFSIQEIQQLQNVSSINLIPFHYENAVSFQIKETLLNVLIFIPFGLYSMMLNWNAKKAVAAGTIFSLTMETCQFIFRLGATDITDIITNTAGTIVGICSYSLLVKILKRKSKVDTIIFVISLIAATLFVILALLLAMAN